jgi:hypothetical protein
MMPELKTRNQWRKQDFRKIKAGEKPASHFTVKYVYRQRQMDIEPDGSVTTTVIPHLKERQIPLYSMEQTQPYQRLGALLLRDAYCRYFVEDARKDIYVWHNDGWTFCRSFLDDEKIRLHLLGKEIYGVYGSDFTCFSAIDADYHGGDFEVFRDQLTVVLTELHGHDGWHYSISPRGIHIIRVHPRISTATARANLRRLLQTIDARHPELRQRAIQAKMKPISDWEIYPDPKQAFRLPLAKGRIVLLDKPCSDLKAYLGWQMEPCYCSLDDVLAQIFKVILPLPMESKDEKTNVQKKKIISEVNRVFGSLRGRYAKVLVDFWLGRDNPPDSLNCAIMLTARMMPFYFNHQSEAVDFIEELVEDLPDVSFSDRLSNGKWQAVTRIIKQSAKAVYEGNSHQSDPQLSTTKLTKTFNAWQKKNFSLVDRSTWGNSGVVLGDDFSFSVEEMKGIAYFSQILKVDLQTAADATRHLLRLLVGHSTGQMSVSFVKKLLINFGVKCGHHGKVNEYLNALAQAGWIAQVGGYVPGRRGRLWQVGQRMLDKFPSSVTTTNKTLSPSIFVSHLPSEEQACGCVLSLSQQTNPLPHLLFASHSTSNKPSLRQKDEKIRWIWSSRAPKPASEENEKCSLC